MLISLFLYEEFVAFQRITLPGQFLLDGFLFFLVLFASVPFEPLLDPLGLWAHNIISGPNNTGLYVVAVFYSIVIYAIWSLVAQFFRKINST